MGNICCSDGSVIANTLPRNSRTLQLPKCEPVTNQSFTVEKVLGRGAFGKVLLVRKNDSRQLFAMKVISKAKLSSNRLKANAVTERRILERVHSPFIVHLHYAFQTAEKLCLVIDYMPGGELYQKLQKAGRFEERRAKFYAGEILMALQALHSQGIIYRDLKPENVLFDLDGHIKLADFNLSKLSSPNFTPSLTFCGTPHYLAPEVLRGEPQDFALDFWAFVRDPNRDIMFRRILSGEFELPKHFSPEVSDLLTALLQKHPFFSEIDWTLLGKRELQPPSQPTSSSISSPQEQINVGDSPTVEWSTPEKQANVFERFTYHGSTQ